MVIKIFMASMSWTNNVSKSANPQFKKATTMKRQIVLALVMAATLTSNAQAVAVTPADYIGVHLEAYETTTTALKLGVDIENESWTFSTNGWDNSIYISGVSFDMDLPPFASITSQESSSLDALIVRRYSSLLYSNRWFVCWYTKTMSYDSDFHLATLTIEGWGQNENGTYEIVVSNIDMAENRNSSGVNSYRKPGFTYQFELKDGIGQEPFPTDIQGVEDKDDKPAAVSPKGIYTLQGVKVDRTRPGNIYIIDGKKVLVK
jgi:hypothetical protein